MQHGYDKEALKKRLHRIEGQVRGIERMVAGERYCIDILTQISAIRSALDRVAIEVLDRIPVTSDKDIEIKLVSSKPTSARITQAERGHPVRGGLAWSITVSPGEKQRIEMVYRVTLPAKNELVGGNRRE